MDTLPTQTALEVFLRGFSATRSFTKPYLSSQVGKSVWMLADAPGGKGPARSSEFIAYGAEPADVVEAIRTQDPARYALCVLIDDASELQQTVATYKALGYRFGGREPLFVLDTRERASFDAIPVRRVVTREEADSVAKAARTRQILPEHLGVQDSACRLYAAYHGDAPIGWVRSIRTHADCAWVSNMFVATEHRRKGIGRSLLIAMLADDARFGVRWSVLLASLTGALLYPHLGYREQGLLLIFTPARSR